MGICAWLVLGGIAGWLASIIKGTNARMGMFANIATGIVGSMMTSVGPATKTGVCAPTCRDVTTTTAATQCSTLNLRDAGRPRRDAIVNLASIIAAFGGGLIAGARVSSH